MNLRLCLLPLVVTLFAPLRAQQDQPVHMRPEFPLVFPLTTAGQTVTVKFPVMINQTTVVKPGMQLRVCYMLSTNSQDPTNLSLVHDGSLENTYARDPAASSGGPNSSGIPSQLAHQIEGYRRTVWGVKDNFVLYLAQFPTTSSHLIFSPTARDSDLRDEIFNFFDGLFIGLPNGKVTVLAVEKESPGEEAGLKAGDVIEAVGAYPTKDDLMTFANAYSAAKSDAKVTEASVYTLSLRGADGTMHTAKVPMPQRLRGGLMDGFSDKP